MELNRLRNGAERRRGRNSSRDIGTRLSPVTFSPSRSGRPADWNVSLFFSLWSCRRDESRSEELRITQTVYGWFRSRVTSRTASMDSSKVNVYLIHDRDPLYTQEFLSMLAEVGIESVKLPPRKPNLNAYAERFVKTIKESCLEKMILFGENSLRNAVLRHRKCPGIIIPGDMQDEPERSRIVQRTLPISAYVRIGPSGRQHCKHSYPERVS